MSVEIKKVTSRKELKQFIRFNYEFYKNNPYAVPDLYDDMLRTFSPGKNAAFDFCEADYFLALREGRIVGRVAAIINRRANAAWKKRQVRFGWIDFIDDIEVSRALIDTVKQWGRERGMDTIEGPLGFTDLDAEGMLIEGFDQLSTMATTYNYPYYPRHMEQLGLVKAVDWVEMKIYVPDEIPEKHLRIADIIRRKYGLHVRKLSGKRGLRRSGLVHDIFRLVNQAYAPLFGFSDASAVAVPITALGAAGAAIGLVPDMASAGTIHANDIAVFTAMCMCWSGYLSTHVGMMSALKCPHMTGKAIVSHTIGGLCAGVAANFIFKLVTLIF